ncbi:CPBP family intramembrane metalloprotease [Hymenobacter lutimineralis]|uniref:CPBP family intramembrane metalloprotease n=1 Tax=Hymenobacter lutimineralis TaxID=2606448 RepID=A0A5D6V6S9_9BACT|nr:CPBP family intramembrane glutamic endopeptidase [Hymenobacter lutimineralis]TYZ11010.1 CPBP family intramembrane metalloprotease [Hymenobacter lutimineralis]
MAPLKKAVTVLVLLILNSLITPKLLVYAGFPNLNPPQYFTDIDAINIFILTILAPLTEVAVFQYLIYFLCKKLRIYPVYYVLFSALLFSISHYYNSAYIVKSFVSGVLYAYLFNGLAQQYTRAIESAIFLTALVHSMHNIFGILYDFLSK